jgi:hypothetical protein
VWRPNGSQSSCGSRSAAESVKGAMRSSAAGGVSEKEIGAYFPSASRFLTRASAADASAAGVSPAAQRVSSTKARGRAPVRSCSSPARQISAAPGPAAAW